MFSAEVLSKFPRKMSHLGIRGSDVSGNIVDLQICSAACHISAHFPCAFVEGEVSSFLERDVIKEKLSNISN